MLALRKALCSSMVPTANLAGYTLLSDANGQDPQLLNDFSRYCPGQHQSMQSPWASPWEALASLFHTRTPTPRGREEAAHTPKQELQPLHSVGSDSFEAQVAAAIAIGVKV